MRLYTLLFCLVSLWGGLLSSSPLQAGAVITDAAGRQVGVPEGIERLVTTYKPATLCVLCLGLQDILVGVDSSSRHDPLTLAVAPEVADLPGVGSKTQGINLETVICLDPDLVVLYSQKSGAQLARRLEQSGCPAVVIQPETFPSIREALRLLASASGHSERAERAIKAMDRVQGLSARRVDSLGRQDRKRVYYAGPRGFFSTAPAGMLQEVMICRAGGINVASHLNGYFKHISVEQLMAWAPDSIVLSRMIRSQAKALLERETISHLPAVQSNDVHVVPSSLAPWDFPSPLSALGVLWLGARLYPDRFADLGLLQEINDFHRSLFGRSLTQMGGRLDDRLSDEATVSGHRNTPDNQIRARKP